MYFLCILTHKESFISPDFVDFAELVFPENPLQNGNIFTGILQNSAEYANI